MKHLLTAAVAFALLVPVSARAGEHPEHPTKKGGHEHPAKKSGKKAKDAQWVSDKKLMGQFSQAVKDFVAEESEETGAFEVYDEELDKTWSLKLAKVHEDRIARLSPEEFFACADFVSTDGKKTNVDLDFFADLTEDGWEVTEVLVHKISGKPRYNYRYDAKKGEWVRDEVGGEKKKPAKHEHPEGGHEHPEHPH